MPDSNHGLKRELKLRDLVSMQLLLVVSLNSAGYAAKQGSSQIVLWLLALVLFYLPLAAVVMQLSRAIPIEGGVYQWVKTGTSPFAGYMAAWSLTVYIIAFFGSYGSQMANGIAYGAGPGGAWMIDSKLFSLSITILICALAFLLNVAGLPLVKWLSGAGGLITIGIFVIMAFLLAKSWLRGHSATNPAGAVAFSFAWPGLSVATLNVFTKMALFSLSGFDQCAIFCEECRKPKNDVARSVLVAAPLIALMYILVTSGVLAWVRPERVDVAAPISQALEAGFGSGPIDRILTATTVGGFNVMLFSALVLVIGMAARLPMVAGWDGILPAWWSELHPRYRTPSKAIGAVTLSVAGMGAASLWGAGNQEAVQALEAAGVGSYCVMYLLLFAQVVFGFRAGGRARIVWRPGIGVRLGALTAFLVVSVSLVFQLIPIGEVQSPAVFAAKVGLAICTANGLGALLYWRGVVRSRKAVARIQA